MTETMDLGYRKISRSAYAQDTAQPLDIYLGICEAHERPFRHEGQPLARRGARYEIPCPGGDTLWAERLIAVTTHVSCDSSCMSARRPSCDCGCGGANHGKSWGVTITRDQFESALLAYREETAKIEAKRTQRRETAERGARKTFDDWAAGHADLVQALEAHKPDDLGYPKPGSNGFLCDLARQVGRGKILTDNQVGAALRCLATQQAREAKHAEYEAAKRPCPEGKTTVSGKIIKVKAQEGYASEIELKMIVGCEGYAVWVSVPAAVRDWARANRADDIYPRNAYFRPAYGDTDYDGIGQRWTNAIKDMAITFSATIERSGKDENFGFAKRPTKITFTAPDAQ